MRVQIVCAGVVACLVGLMVTVMAQNTPKLELVGDRFKPLTYEKMTPEQKRMTDNILNSERKSMGGPFNALLRSPEMGISRSSSAPTSASVRRCRAISTRWRSSWSARVWTAQYEWYVHKQAALNAGLNPAIVSAIAENKRPASMKPDEQAHLRVHERAARHQTRQRRDLPERGQGVRREGRRRSDRRDRLLRDGVGAAERRSLPAARGRETRAGGTSVTND